MTHGTHLGLAATTALAFFAAAAVLPAAAQEKIYSPLTDCSKLVGNDKAACDHQAKNNTSPDNANNPDNSSINTSNPPVYETMGTGVTTGTTTMPSSKTYPPNMDCSKLVGNSQTDCMNQPKN
jgi:uncharacterized protein YgiB involved in biofilm formation